MGIKFYFMVRPYIYFISKSFFDQFYMRLAIQELHSIGIKIAANLGHINSYVKGVKGGGKNSYGQDRIIPKCQKGSSYNFIVVESLQFRI